MRRVKQADTRAAARAKLARMDVGTVVCVDMLWRPGDARGTIGRFLHLLAAQQFLEFSHNGSYGHRYYRITRPVPNRPAPFRFGPLVEAFGYQVRRLGGCGYTHRLGA